MRGRQPALVAKLAARLQAAWFNRDPGTLAALLVPLSWLYGSLQRRARRANERRAQTIPQPACPVVVVGNLIVGGAGKTPTTLAVLQALGDAGYTPGVVSRGHGGRNAGASAVTAVRLTSDADDVGDEPLLIHRRSARPVVVGRDRVAAAQHLLQAHPQVDVIVSDDGLQHRQLARDVEVVVFDERGIGNGRLLPAGPLREPFEQQPPTAALVLYNHGQPTTAWPGACAARRLRGVWPLQAWLRGGSEPAPLSALHGRRLLAVAGIAVPERFFAALEGAGLAIERLAMPDHHDYATLPWPPDTPDVITTEKDAVKLAAHADGGTAIWVVGLDLELPARFVAELLARVAQSPRRRPCTGAPPSSKDHP